jgi:hypothetical protein
MTLVKVLAFGSNWWARVGRDPDDRYRYTKHAAYFNSTGLRCGVKVRRQWILPGLIRFNGVGDFNPQFPGRSIGTTFECTDLVCAFGGNRMLFLRRPKGVVQPDCFLAVLSSERHGTFDCRTNDWKSDSLLPIAVSQTRNGQEAMLLMRRLDWVRTTLGVWQLRPDGGVPQGAVLMLLEDAGSVRGVS